MFISLEWDIFLKMRFFLSKIISKMTLIQNKNKNNCFQILLQTVLSVKQMIGNCIIFHWYFCEALYKTSGVLVIYELRVASCELQVASCKLIFLGVENCELMHFASCILRVENI